jgi:hypothetical protein
MCLHGHPRFESETHRFLIISSTLCGYQHIVDVFEIPTIITSEYHTKGPMDEHTYNNWVKVKETFEQSGNTDNMFYRRACAIVSGQPDPLAKMLGDEK